LRERLSLFVGWLTMFLVGIDLFVVSPLLPFIAETYRISTAMTGWMVTVFSITYAVFIPLFGWMSDRYGRSLFISFGLTLFVISSLLTAYAPSFIWLIVSRILAGLSVASITPVIYAIISDIAPAHRRGTWLSITVSGHIAALSTGAPIGAILEHFLGWRSVFVALAIVGALLIIVNFKAWKNIKKNSSTNKPFEGNILRIFRSVTVTASWGISMYALYVYLGAALYVEHRFTTAEVAIAITVYGIGAVIGSLSGGQLSDRFGEIRVTKLAFRCLIVILICLSLLFTSSQWLYSLLFIWALVGYTAFTSYKARLAAQYPHERGIAMAWNMTALYIGITVGSMLGGIVISQWGYSFLPYLCSIAAIFSFVLSMQKIKQINTESTVSTTMPTG